MLLISSFSVSSRLGPLLTKDAVRGGNAFGDMADIGDWRAGLDDICNPCGGKGRFVSSNVLRFPLGALKSWTLFPFIRGSKSGGGLLTPEATTSLWRASACACACRCARSSSALSMGCSLLLRCRRAKGLSKRVFLFDSTGFAAGLFAVLEGSLFAVLMGSLGDAEVWWVGTFTPATIVPALSFFGLVWTCCGKGKVEEVA